MAFLPGLRGGTNRNDLFAPTGLMELPNHAPGLQRDAGAEMSRFGKDPGEEPKGGIAAIQEEQIVLPKIGAVGKGEIALVNPIGVERGMKGDAIEKIVKLRGPSHGTLVMRNGWQVVEMFERVLVFGESESGSVNGQQTKTMPSSQGKMRFEILNQVLIEFDERLIVEFGTRLGEGGFGQGTDRSVRAMEDLKKRVQFGLDGAFEKIDHEKNQRRKRQQTGTREVMGSGFMTVDERFRVENIFESFAQVGTIFKRNPCQLIGILKNDFSWDRFLSGSEITVSIT